MTEKILATTIELLAEVGLPLTVDQVAARAEVNKTTIYRRWDSVEDLMLDAVLAQAAVQVPIPDTGDRRADLIELGRRVVANLSSPTGRALMVLASASLQWADLRQRFWQERLQATTPLLTGPGPAITFEHLVGPIQFRLFQLDLPVDDAYLADLVDRLLAGI